MKIENIKTESLVPYARNAKTHPPAQVARIAGSIKEFGFCNPVLVDKDNGIIAGHGRVLAAQKLGLAEVPCIRLGHLTDAQRRAYILADNRLSESDGSGWDMEMLKLELADLGELDVDLEGIGFGADDLADMELDMGDGAGNGEVDAEPQIDKAEELRVKWGVETGQLWQLGDHRILCGDSTNAEDVARVMGGEKADICFTSPPYALGKSVALSGNKSMAAKGNAYDEHGDDSESWGDLMNRWWEQSLMAVSTVWIINVQPLAGNKRDLIHWIANRSNRIIDIITWDKGHAQPPMAPGVLASRYEWILALGKDKSSRAFPMSTWRGTIQSVYQGPPQRSNEHSQIHAATMPTHLPTWVVGTLCDQTKSVYEPFCGTGTTIIACEQLGRKCRAIEISPGYVAVAIQRWADATGKEPKLIK
jgi:DNA modification methylase